MLHDEVKRYGLVLKMKVNRNLHAGRIMFAVQAKAPNTSGVKFALQPMLANGRVWMVGYR